MRNIELITDILIGASSPFASIKYINVTFRIRLHDGDKSLTIFRSKLESTQCETIIGKANVYKVTNYNRIQISKGSI